MYYTTFLEKKKPRRTGASKSGPSGPARHYLVLVSTNCNWAVCMGSVWLPIGRAKRTFVNTCVFTTGGASTRTVWYGKRRTCPDASTCGTELATPAAPIAPKPARTAACKDFRLKVFMIQVTPLDDCEVITFRSYNSKHPSHKLHAKNTP